MCILHKIILFKKKTTKDNTMIFVHKNADKKCEIWNITLTIIAFNFIFYQVDGQWSIWTEWTGCSQSCGGGVMTRNRRCDSPPPDPEGASCVGNDRETKPCEEQVCPGKGRTSVQL